MRRKTNDNPIEVQAVWFRTDKWTLSAAKSWLDDHEFKTDVVRERLDDEGAVSHYIFAQFDPKDADDSTWATLSDGWPDGISVSTAKRKQKAVPMDLKQKAGTQSADDPWEFVLSDESVDRVGDIIEAKGWLLDQFRKNPVALFGHDHTKPIGAWEDVKVVGKRLMGKLRLAKQGTSAEIDAIRSLVEQRILKAVSVGFSPIEYEPIKDKDGRPTGGYRFKKQSLHETSLVAVPCNGNALSLAKSAGLDGDALNRIFLDLPPQGHSGAPTVIGKSGGKQTGGMLAKEKATSTSKGKIMNIADRIAAKQERVVGIKDALTELKALAEAEEFEGFTEEQEDQIETLNDEMARTIKSIESLEKMEQGIAAKAVPVQSMAPAAARPATGGAFPVEEKGGELMTKLATIKLISHMTQTPEAQVVADRYGHDDRVKAVHDMVTKTSVMPATTTATGWAAELVQNDVRGFMRDLQPVSVYAALRARGTGLDFGTANSITIPSRSNTDRGLSPAFIGEGGVIPVGKTTFQSQTLNRYKVAIISNWTNELMQQSTPNIEALVRQGIIDDTAVKLDSALLDGAAAVAGVRPASILSGVTGTASSGATASNIVTDLKVLLGAMAAANLGADPVLIMNSSRLLGLATVMNATGQFLFRDEIAQGRLLGVPVITSTNVPAAQVVIVDANSFAAANAVPELSVSDQATLVQANADGTAPTMAGAASDYTGGAVGTPGEVKPDGGIIVTGDAAGAPTGASVAGYQALSMYQVYSTAIRMVLPTSWAVTRAGAVDQITGAAW